MCRFVEAARPTLQAIKRPAIWILLATWGTLTAFVYLLTPIAPVHQLVLDQSEFPNPLKGMPYGCNTIVLGSSNDGTIVATAIRPPWSRWNAVQGPIHIWSLREGKQLNQLFTAEDYFGERNVRLTGDGQWLRADKQDETDFYNVIRGDKITFDRAYSDICQSQCGRWLAFWHENTLQFYDVRTHQIEAFEDSLKEHDDGVRRRLRGFSEHDHWLIIETYQRSKDNHHVELFDIHNGDVVKKARLRKDASEIKVARDGKSLAVTEFAGNLIVIDMTDQDRVVDLGPSMFLGWDRSQRHVIVWRHGPNHEKGDAEPTRLEAWNIATGKRHAVWHVPTPPEPRGNLRQIGLRYGRPALSPDGARVLWATYQQDESPSLGWQQQVRAWLALPPPPSSYYEARILDTATFAELDHWNIPTSGFSFHNAPVFEWKPVGDRLFFCDGENAEIWRVPPRSLAESAAISFFLAWALCGVWLACRSWRRRQRATIAPPPTPAKLAEVSHAKT